MSEYLFIGGPLDGQRIDTGGRVHWTVIKNTPHERTDPMSPFFDTVTYRFQMLRGNRGDYGVYLPDYANADAIAALIDRYPKPCLVK